MRWSFPGPRTCSAGAPEGGKAMGFGLGTGTTRWSGAPGFNRLWRRLEDLPRHWNRCGRPVFRPTPFSMPDAWCRCPAMSARSPDGTRAGAIVSTRNDAGVHGEVAWGEAREVRPALRMGLFHHQYRTSIGSSRLTRRLLHGCPGKLAHPQGCTPLFAACGWAGEVALHRCESNHRTGGTRLRRELRRDGRGRWHAGSEHHRYDRGDAASTGPAGDHQLRDAR